MKKWFKSIIAVALAAAMTTSFTACGKSDSASSQGGTPSAGAAEATTLKVYMFGTAKNADKVLNKFYDETKSTLNTKLDIVWAPGSDHKQNIPLLIQNKQEADLVFDAYWMNLAKMKSDGAYADLSKYFNNDQYPGLKKAFPPEVINQVKETDGKIYSIPFYERADDQSYCIFLRKDLREKYNLPEVKDLATLQKYLDTINQHKSELNMVAPLGLGERGFFRFNDQTLSKRAANVFSIDSTGAKATLEFQVALDKSGKKVQGVAGIGDPDNKFSAFPTPFNTNYMDARYIDLANSWAKYVQKDSNIEKDATKNLFNTGKVAATEGALDGYQLNTDNIKKLTGKDNNVEVYMYDDVERSNGKIVKAQLTTNNFLCVPYYSTKIDRTMKFLDWIYSSQENHDLFEYGIKGEDWEAAGDKEYKNLTPANKYVFPGYELTWNPNYARTVSGMPDNIKALNSYMSKPETYTESPIAGFVFNTNENSEVKRAYASFSKVQSDYYSTLSNGIYGKDTKAKLAEYYQKAQASGMEVIREAVKRQIQAYLDAKKK